MLCQRVFFSKFDGGVRDTVCPPSGLAACIHSAESELAGRAGGVYIDVPQAFAVVDELIVAEAAFAGHYASIELAVEKYVDAAVERFYGSGIDGQSICSGIKCDGGVYPSFAFVDRNVVAVVAFYE